ncbi:MAG: gas vesicle protein K [Pseudomonadota bacterium]
MADADIYSLFPGDIGQLAAKLGDETGRIQLNPDTVEADLARLVLGLMAFLRELMELQAIRRLENGSLSDAEEERVGTTLMRAETAIYEMAARFGLEPSDLSLDLGPLGRTI